LGGIEVFNFILFNFHLLYFYLVVLVGPPVSVHRGHTTTLPCWLNPLQSAEDLEVRWFRDNDFDSPIILYQGKKVTVNQEASYAGRVSFGLKDTNSDGLKSGDVSLKLENAVIEDIGEYTCYVSSYQGYDSATINLLVTGESPPLLSAVWTEDNRVNVSCESEGWYPKPALRWLDQTQDLTPGTVLYGNGSSGLVSVSSWVLVKSSSEVSCSIGNTSRLQLNHFLSDFSTIRFIFATRGVAACWLLERMQVQFPDPDTTSIFYKQSMIISMKDTAVHLRSSFKMSGCDRFSLGDKVTRNREIMEQISGVVFANFLSESQIMGKEIQLSVYITMKGTLLRDAPCDDFPDGQNVTCLTAVKGTSGFSCGRHYWEVSLNNPKLGPKQSWWVGVTSATKIPQKLDPPNTADGFWFLSSSPNRADRFQFSTEPKVFIGCPRPQTVGVFLDYDGGELYFYNVEDTTLIGSFKATFRGEVFPLFNPGKGDQAPLEILHREEVNQSGDERDCVVSVAQ
uniref:Uncharacterized protein n=1 Tax=Amphiprion percula TaxID=161767 RepID=A0A3P8U936_AMPPE